MTYLQKTGFISSIAKLILNLYDCEGLPEDGEAIEYMAKSQGYGLTINLELPATLAYIDELKKEVYYIVNINIFQPLIHYLWLLI